MEKISWAVKHNVVKADSFADEAHASVNQLNKYTGEPYISHPRAVAQLVSTVSHTIIMLQAALLHDVVEDTGVSNEEIRSEFGDQVADMVSEITDVSTRLDGNRKTRKDIDALHLSNAKPDTMTVKLADTIVNLKDFSGKDPEFAKVYIPEKYNVIILLKDGDPILWHQAHELCLLLASEYGIQLPKKT